MEEKKIIDQVSMIGLTLLNNGAEIYRVEESIKRMLCAYGFTQNDVFAIPSFLSVSIKLDNDNVFTVTKRSTSSSINLDKIFELNNLVRYISNESPPHGYIEERINKINSFKPNILFEYIGYGLTTGFFTIFFGGGIIEGIIGMLIGLLICYINTIRRKYHINMIVDTLVKSMIIAFLVVLTYNIGIISDISSTTTGILMLLVPGVAITNSLRDIVSSDYLSGVSRITEAIIIAIMIAIGVGFVYSVMGV